MKKSENLIITINNQQTILVINRKKIKNTYIRIDDNKQIVVNTNHLTSVDYIIDLVYKHQQQIVKQIERKTKHELPRNQIAYLGKIYHVVVMNSNEFAYKIENNTIIIYTNKTLEIAVELFYRNQAQELFSIELIRAFGFYERNFKIKYPELEIRKMKHRYGTCYYRRNKICLNLNLIKHDLECIHYVINHELCHFIYHDHSRDFYKLLGTVVSNHKELRRKLFNL